MANHTTIRPPHLRALAAAAILSAAPGCACPDRVEIINATHFELFVEAQMRNPGKFTPRLCKGELARTLSPGDRWSTAHLRNLEPVRSDMPTASASVQIRVRREHSIFPETIALRRRNLEPLRITLTIAHDEEVDRFTFEAIDHEGRSVEVHRDQRRR